MASTALVKDILRQASVLLQDTAPQFSRVAERDMVNWLMDGEAAIAKFIPLAASRVDAIKLRSGSRQDISIIAAADCKPGDGTTPTAPINGTLFLNPRRNMGSSGTTPGRAIRMVERDLLDATDPLWHTRTGPAVMDLVFDVNTPRQFYVYPAPESTTWIEIAYAARPLAIPNTGTAGGGELYAMGGSSTQTITVDDEFTEDLVDYICARAHLIDTTYSEPAKAQFHAAKFIAMLNAKVTVVTGTNPNLTVLPGLQPQKQ